MKKIGYFTKLSLAARWFLPETEAGAVIEDYREILAEMGEEEGEKKFGPPVKAVLKIADKRSVAAWHLAFAAMAVLTLFQAHHVACHEYYPMVSLAFNVMTGGILFFSLPWGPWKNPFSQLKHSKPLLASVAVLLALILGIPLLFGGLNWKAMSGTLLFFARRGFHLFEIPRYVPIFSAIFSVGSIVLARIASRRWRAPAILGLTLITECLIIISVVGNMDPAAGVREESGSLLAVIVLGLFGAGAGLC